MVAIFNFQTHPNTVIDPSERSADSYISCVTIMLKVFYVVVNTYIFSRAHVNCKIEVPPQKPFLQRVAVTYLTFEE